MCVLCDDDDRSLLSFSFFLREFDFLQFRVLKTKKRTDY